MWGAVLIILTLVIGFYLRIFSVVQDKNQVYVENIISQVEESIVTSTNNIQKIATDVAFSKPVQEYFYTTNEVQRFKLIKEIESIINSIIGFNKDIADISVINSNNVQYTYYSSGSFVEYNIIKSAESLYSGNDIVSPMFVTFPADNMQGANTYYCYVLPIYSTTLSETSKIKIGTVFILCRTTTITNSINNLKLSAGNIFHITDSNNVIIASNIPNTEGSIFDRSNYSNKKIVDSEQISKTNWSIVSIVSESELATQILSISYFVVCICGVFVVLLFIVNLIFRRSIIYPIERITDSIVNIGEHNIKQRIDLKLGNEFGIIKKSINSMLDRMEYMTKKILSTQQKLYEVEIVKNEAALSALQSQINPHFLYNTLECIRSIGLAYKSQEIVDISTALADIFRYSIKGSSEVRISDEIGIILKYIRIMNIRFDEKFIVEIDIPEELNNKRIIKMLLQPIVENAIYHGLESVDEGGHLLIKAREVDGKIVFVIADDGCGISGDKMDNINDRLQNYTDSRSDTQKSGIGISNVNARLKMIFGSEYGISLSSHEGIGCEVTISMPSNI